MSPDLPSQTQEDFSRGMDDSSAASRHPANAAALIENGRVEPDGTVSRRYGSRRRNETVFSDLIGYGATTFIKADGTEQQIAFEGAYAYVSTDGWANRTQIGSSLAAGYYDFATMRIGGTNYLYAANGASVVKQWDGTTLSDLSNAPSGVTLIEPFNRRLYMTGHSGVTLLGTKIDDPTTVTTPDAVSIPVQTSDGQPPTGLFQLGPHLLVFDRRSVSYVDGFGNQTIIVATGATGFSRSVGCVAFRSIVGVGDDGVCWLSKRGLEYYSARTGIVLLTRGLRKFMRSVNYAAIEGNPGVVSAVYDQLIESYLCALPTSTSQNSRIVCVNLSQRGQGWLGAPSIDRKETDDVDALLFSADANGYEESGSGYELRADSQGYETLDTGGLGGTPIAEDASGYEDEITDDTFPSTLFMGTASDGYERVHSQGYDGYIREHAEYDNDDELLDASGGQPITMKVVSKPFPFRSLRQKKRVRVAHVAGIQDAAATYDVAVRSAGALGTSKSVTLPATDFNQATRGRKGVSGKGDAPALEVTTTDRTRLALLGLSAEELREPV